MRPVIQRLRAEIRSDRDALDERLSELSGIDLSDASHDRGQLALSALCVHHAYSAVESILLRVARFLEGEESRSPDWHRALLESMGLELAGVRPAILEADTVRLLHRLLAFRHFLRHAYTAELDVERLRQLQEDAAEVLPLLNADLDRLDGFLGELASASGT